MPPVHMGDEEVLEIDGVVHEDDVVPALSVPSAHDLSRRRPLPVSAQVVAVAATGFAAGAVAAAVIHVARARRPVRPRHPRGVPLGPRIVATRSFLIDVHVLAPRD